MTHQRSDCPATQYVDSGDYAEPVECSLSLEHNADDEPWHEGGYTGDGEDVTIRWRWDKEELVRRWPPPVDPFAKVWSAHYVDRLVKLICDENVLFNNIPVTEIPVTGTTVQWREWGSLSKAVDAETAPTGGETTHVQP